ncbi:hypothetical protein V8C86DRAFT_2457911 [Haematococcus lacustris]
MQFLYPHLPCPPSLRSSHQPMPSSMCSKAFRQPEARLTWLQLGLLQLCLMTLGWMPAPLQHHHLTGATQPLALGLQRCLGPCTISHTRTPTQGSWARKPLALLAIRLARTCPCTPVPSSRRPPGRLLALQYRVQPCICLALLATMLHSTLLGSSMLLARQTEQGQARAAAQVSSGSRGATEAVAPTTQVGVARLKPHRCQPQAILLPLVLLGTMLAVQAKAPLLLGRSLGLVGAVARGPTLLMVMALQAAMVGGQAEPMLQQQLLLPPWWQGKARIPTGLLM